MIGFVSSSTRALIPLDFQLEDGVRMVTIPAAATVSAASTNAFLAKLGLGLIQVPRHRVAHEVETGELVEILAAWPPTPSPVYILYPEGRQLSPRVRLFLDWAAAEVAAHLEQG